MSDYLPHVHEGGVYHYYGDQMRQLFLSAAALILIGAPFYADSLLVELPFEIAGALLLVALAALANPHNRSIFTAGAVIAGVGAVIYETWALYMYFDSTWVQFLLREIIAIIFLVAFYFNLKTVRAFLLHQVGKHDTAGEFDESVSAGARTAAWGGDFVPWFLKNNHEKEEKSDESETGPRMSPGRKPEEIKPKYHPYEDTM